MRNITMLFAAGLLATSCVEHASYDIDETERMALGEWIAKNKPFLAANYQQQGGYYVEVLDEGCPDSLPLNDTVCWVRYNFTGRQLNGSIVLTRDGQDARLAGSFTRYTHYVPFYRFCGETNSSMLEGTFLAMRNKLKVGDGELLVRYGTKLRLYMPSSVTGGTVGVSGSGGYEGQYSLDGNRPMIADIEVVGRVKNPIACEGDAVDAFATANGGINHPPKKDDTAPKGAAAENDAYVWSYVADTIPQLYVDRKYTPKKHLVFKTPAAEAEALYSTLRPYKDHGVYDNLDALNERIDAALLARFGEGAADGEAIEEDATVAVWYVGRFLDGFVFDTNIDEVKELIYGEVSKSGSALSFDVDDKESQYIAAWRYSIPTFKYGQWAALLTVSTFGYSYTGMAGNTSTQTTSSGGYDALSYAYWLNSMNSYYGGMYNYGYYNNYYPYYGYPYYGYDGGSTETTTTTTVSTEIQSYTPLLFQIYIEEKDS